MTISEEKKLLSIRLLRPYIWPMLFIKSFIYHCRHVHANETMG